MSASRSANHTIAGFKFQLLVTIDELLNGKPDDVITIEGLEDVDIDNLDGSSLVQCKYYESTKYTPSLIKDAIVHMVTHFAMNRSRSFKYYIYAHYTDKGEAPILPTTLDALKKIFLTKKIDKKVQRVYDDLHLADSDLEKFIKKLKVDIDADRIDNFEKVIISNLAKSCCINEIEARHHSFPIALSIVHEIATRSKLSERKITCSDFIERIRSSDAAFFAWHSRCLGSNAYCKHVRSILFRAKVNMPNLSRFFDIEISSNDTPNAIKSAICTIVQRFAPLSLRKRMPCLVLYLRGISESKLLQLKNDLHMSGYVIADGYQYRGSDFSPSELLVTCSPGCTRAQQYVARLVTEKLHLDKTLEKVDGAIALYHLYRTDIPAALSQTTARVFFENIEQIEEMVR